MPAWAIAWTWRKRLDNRKIERLERVVVIQEIQTVGAVPWQVLAN